LEGVTALSATAIIAAFALLLRDCFGRVYNSIRFDQLVTFLAATSFVV